MTFTISNFAGLGAGETLVITGVAIAFGNIGGETYTVNGGGDTAFGAGSTGVTRFAIDTFTVEVVSSIPEPSGVSLLALAGLALMGRRRR